MMTHRVDNAKGHILAYFDKTLTVQTGLGFFEALAGEADRRVTFRELVVFDYNIALHQIELDEVKAVHQLRDTTATANELRRERCAFVSLNAEKMPFLNYWKALCESNNRVGTEYRLFSDLADAAHWSGIAMETVRQFVDDARAASRQEAGFGPGQSSPNACFKRM